MAQTNSKDASQLIQEVLTRGQIVVLFIVKLGVVSSKEAIGDPKISRDWFNGLFYCPLICAPNTVNTEVYTPESPPLNMKSTALKLEKP